MRAISILCVVAGHMFLPTVYYTHFQSFFSAIPFLFFSNCTIWFVFISGFIYCHTKMRSSRPYHQLIKHKIINLYFPMLFMSIPAIFLFVIPCLNLLIKPSSLEYIFVVFLVYILGLSNGSYWYILYILSVFFISPLLLYIAQKKYIFFFTFSIMTLCFFFFPRSLTIFPENLLYFTPVFLLGIISRLNFIMVQVFLLHNKQWLSVLAILLYFISHLIFLHFIGSLDRQWLFNRNIPWLMRLGIMMFSWFKVVLFFLIWTFFISHPNLESKLLNLIANHSFGIYFIHAYFLSYIFLHYQSIWPRHQIYGSILSWILALIVPVVSLIVSLILHKIFGRYSKYLIGVK
mgnify:FL=1